MMKGYQPMRYPFSLFKKPADFIDMWSVPHFLLGTLIAMFGRVFDYPALPLLLVTLIIAILWEWVEMRLRIRESQLNVVSDILMPLFAYVVTLWLAGGERTTHEQRVALLIVTIIFYTLVSYAAWRARFDDDPDFQG